MEIELRDVIDQDFMDVVNLEVRPGQADRVAPNVWSLAQAKVNPRRLPYAVYHRDTLVGFVMYDATAREPGEYHISRLMIGKEHQGKGHGRATMVEVIRRIKECPTVWRSNSTTR
jgi:diamine N-acetyltransferase